MTTLPSKVTMTKEGGHWYKVQIVFFFSVVITVIPILCALLIAIFNPFWFRDDLLLWLQNKVEQFARWRNRILYRIYLGTDPEVWHALKGEGTHVGTDGSP